MKQQEGLNSYEHLRDPDGRSIGTINRAVRALSRAGERISKLGLPISTRYHIGLCEETYDMLQNRAGVLHQERIRILQAILHMFIENDRISFEDGGIKLEVSLERKMEYTPGIITPNRCLDLSRCRIVTEDLQTLHEAIDCLQQHFHLSEKLCIRDTMNRYIIPKNGKSVYPAFFLYLADMVEYRKILQSDGTGGSKKDISTEIQVMTRRVRAVSEANRDEYAAARNTQRNGDNSFYNKAMLRAILLDWKEYFGGPEVP